MPTQRDKIISGKISNIQSEIARLEVDLKRALRYEQATGKHLLLDSGIIQYRISNTYKEKMRLQAMLMEVELSPKEKWEKKYTSTVNQLEKAKNAYNNYKLIMDRIAHDPNAFAHQERLSIEQVNLDFKAFKNAISSENRRIGQLTRAINQIKQKLEKYND